MRVHLERKRDLYLESQNGSGNLVAIDGLQEPSGKGMRPMELLLSALASCSSMSLIVMAEKQQMELDEFHVEISGKRDKKGAATPFSHIHLCYSVKGKVDENKFSVLAKLAAEKYCSVASSLSSDVVITHEVKLL